MYLSPVLLCNSLLFFILPLLYRDELRHRASSFPSQGRRPFSALVVALQHEMAAFSIYPLHIWKIPPIRI